MRVRRGRCSRSATRSSSLTRDPNVAAGRARRAETWRTLYLAQPLNALVFVYDGFMYAFQDFAYIRELMEVGVGYAFLPSLAWTAAGRPGGCTLGRGVEV